MPLKSMTKQEIDEAVEFFLNDALEVHMASNLWIMAKQMEEAVKLIKEKLQTVAFDQIAKELGGSMSGEIMGHKVQLTLPQTWVYPPEVENMVRQQKLDLKAAQTKAQADGTAHQESKEVGIIRVTIRGSK
jgi:hypothetical protein